MGFQISDYILLAQSTDADLRKKGVLHLKKLREQDFSGYLLSLSKELLDEGDGTSDYRTLAGILFKNCLDANTKEDSYQKWESLDVSRRRKIQEALLQSLGSPSSDLGKVVAQIIAEIASLLIPRKEWPGLIDLLLGNMTHEGKEHASLRQATMQSLGYVCEGLSHNDLAQDEVDRILKAVVQAMRCSEELSVRLAATTALYNTLGKNFKIENERDPIMEAVFTTTADVDFELKKGAFECLVSISSAHYEVLGPSMPKLFEVTTNAMMYEGEDVALRAVQVWSCICDEEIKRRAHSQWIQKCTRSLVDMLLETLGENIIPKKGENILKNKSGNLSKAAGTCLGLVARVVGDSIVELVMPFVQVGLVKGDVESHAAGVYAFGSILEGPSVETLSFKLRTVFYRMLNLMRDKDSHVKGSTVWTLRRIFELLRSPDSGFPFISADQLKKIIPVLLESLNDPPEFAEKVCEVLFYLVQGYENIEGISSELTLEITTSLIATAERTDAYVSMLRSAAYKTLNEVVRCSNLSETSETITQLLETVLEKLKSDDLPAFFWGVLQVIIRKLCSTKDTKESVLKAADKIVKLLIKVFDRPSLTSGLTVHKQAMLATGALVYAMGPKFNPYMPRFVKYVQKDLQKSVDSQVLIVSVGLVKELCQALGGKMSQYRDEIMELLKHNLSRSDLDRSVKPPIILCFGDMALACGSRVSFEKYVSEAMLELQKAVKDCKQIDANDEEMMEYGNELKRSIFGAYSGILPRPEADLMLPHAGELWNFIQVVIEDKHSVASVVMAAATALGVYVQVLRSHRKENDLKVIRDFIEKCNQSGDKQLLKKAKLIQESIDQNGP